MNLGRFFNFPPTLSRQLRSNFTYYFWDIGWWGLYTGGTAAFLAIYATRCGATAEQIGLLTALPALLSALISLPVGRWLKRFPAKNAAVWSAFGQRILFIVYALLPWLLPVTHQFDAILVIAILMVIPNTVVGISFTQLFMEAVPSEWRGVVVGARNAIGSIVAFVAVLLSGQILSHIPFPLGYQIVFVFGFIGGIMTVYQIYRVHPVASPNQGDRQVILDRLQNAPNQKLKFFPQWETQGKLYIRIVGLLFLFNLSNNMVAPLIPGLLVHQLKLSDGLISIGTAISTLLVMIVSLFIAQMTRRSGNRRATALGAGLLAFQTLALALAQNSALYLVAAVIGGIATGILNTAQYNYHLDNVPGAEPSRWLSINLLLGNTAVLLGSLIGPILARQVGTPEALIVFGGLRLAICLVIARWG